MGIAEFYLGFKKPFQYIYAGESNIDIFKIIEGNLKRTKRVENLSILDLNGYDFLDIKRELSGVETGIVLNSRNFIFNIFEFDKIPINEIRRRDIIEWRLSKVFPENIDQYKHDYFRLNKKRVLSILFKKSFKDEIENLFEKNNIRLIYIGNSTIEIFNNLSKRKISPDFFIEIDGKLAVLLFQSNSIPFYIRKFEIEKASDLIREILKTIHFVRENHSKELYSYSIVLDDSDVDSSQIRGELSTENIKEINISNKDNLFLPI